VSIEITQRQDKYSLMKAGYIMADECERCHSRENLVIDHIIALSQGGSNALSNLRTLCQSCNTKQGWQNRARPELEKYTTHLTPVTIKAVKRYAFEHEMKDYEVVQAALDLFLSRDESVS